MKQQKSPSTSAANQPYTEEITTAAPNESTTPPTTMAPPSQPCDPSATPPTVTQCDVAQRSTSNVQCSTSDVQQYPLKWRGTLTQLDAKGNCEFRAQLSKGEPAQEVISKTGEAKLYTTTAQKKTPRMVAHLSVPADAPDPVASMTRQFNALTKDMKAKSRPQLKGERLMCEDGVTVTLDPAKATVRVEIDIELKANPNYMYTLPQKLAKATTCLFTNREKVQNALK